MYVHVLCDQPLVLRCSGCWEISEEADRYKVAGFLRCKDVRMPLANESTGSRIVGGSIARVMQLK